MDQENIILSSSLSRRRRYGCSETVRWREREMDEKVLRERRRKVGKYS